MEFSFDATIDSPIDRVLPVLRDRLPELVPYMPTIAKIDPVDRTPDETGGLLIVRLWEGNSKMFPPIARPFVTRAMRTWKEFALWSEDGARIEWRHEPFRFAKLFTCGGVNHVADLGGGKTRVQLAGGLVVHPTEVPGVTMRMARWMAPKIERWVVATIEPNLAQVPGAVQALLDHEQQMANQGRDQGRDHDDNEPE